MSRANKATMACCFAVMFLHTGINGVATAAMPQLRAYYNCSLTDIIYGASVCSAAMFIASFYAAAFIRRFTPKFALLIASACGVIFSVVVAFSTTLWSFYLGCAFAGLMAAWGTHATCSHLFRTHFSESTRIGVLIALLSTVAMLGSAGFQFFAGQVLAKYTLRVLYLIMAGCGALAMLTSLLLPRQRQLPLADEKGTRPQKAQSNQALYKSVPFVLLIVTAFMGMALSVFGSQLTTFLQTGDIGVAQSTTILSLYTLLTGLLAPAGGKIADKFGPKAYLVTLYAFFIVAMGLVIVYTQNRAMWVLAVAIPLMATAVSVSSFANILAGPLFKEQSLIAHTKLLAASNLGGALLLPVFSTVTVRYGFLHTWVILSLTAAVCMGMSGVAVRIAEKKETVSTASG